MRLAVLLCVPAWCHGEHALPRPSLVQVSSRGAAHAKAEAESLSRTLSGFQKFTDSLVEEYKDNAKSNAHLMVPVNNTMATTINRIIEFIDGFFGSAEAQHIIDERDSEACSKNTCFGECSFGAKHTTEVIKTEMAQVQTALEAIRTCLDTNSAGIQENEESCTAWDSFRMGNPMTINNELKTAPHLPSCVSESKTKSEDFCNDGEGDFCDERIKADENDEEDELEAMEECLDETNVWMTIMWEAFGDCSRGTGEQSLECQETVNEYHRDHCEYTMVVSDDCKKYDMCVDDCDDDCNSLCDRVEIQKKARMADNETGERIKCLLAALVDEVGDNVTNTNEAKTAKQDALAACINEDAKVDYATKAKFFDIICASTVNKKEYPDGVNCEHRDQPVSCSIDYMNKLMNDDAHGVPELRDYDASNPDTETRNQLWNSCECGHKCQAGNTDSAQVDGFERGSTNEHNYTHAQGPDSYEEQSQFCGGKR